ncbi:MAG TPA: glutaredoxin family protein [Candidatus Limnocylindrales bacterium]|nr:glutaredoxin family protein [Candidatus Limnocylindrales bacterium]
MSPDLPELVLYGRPGCHLCEEARAAVQSVLEDRASHGLPIPRVVERNIDTDEAWHRAYLERIPVLELDGHRLELVVTYGKVRRILADALDGATLV